MTIRVHTVGEFLDVLRTDEQLPLVVLVALHQTLLLLVTGRGSGSGGGRYEHLLHIVHLQESFKRRTFHQCLVNDTLSGCCYRTNQDIPIGGNWIGTELRSTNWKTRFGEINCHR